MATVANFIDATLQAATSRTVNLSTANIQLDPDAPLFKVAVDGAITPASITFTATLVDLDAPLVFNCTGGTLTNMKAKSVTLAAADMTGTSAVVIASATINGTTYTKSCTISKLQDGAPGTSTPGSRGAGHYYGSGSAWTDALANVTAPSPKVAGDVVTISSGTFVMEKRWTGSAWVDNGVVIDGKVIVPQSILAGSIDTRGLTVKDAQGKVIVGIGSALDPAYAAAGTLNADLVPSIAAAAQSGVFTPVLGLTFNFTSDVEGWYGTGATLAASGGVVTLSSTSTDPMLTRDNLGSYINGNVTKIRVRIRRKAGTGWDGQLFYSNVTHGFDGNYNQRITADPTVKDQWVVAEWDMATGSNPTDWAKGAIYSVRIDLGSTASDVFDIDWISFGNANPVTLSAIGYSGDTNATYGANANNFTGTIGGDNLAPNSSFERNNANSTGPDGYNIYNNAGTNEPTTMSIEVGRTGGKSVAVSWSPNHTQSKGIFGQVCRGGWIPGKTYMLSVWAKTTALSSPANAGLDLRWNVYPAQQVSVQNPVINSTWQRYVFRLVWGTSVEGGGVAFLTVSEGSGNGNVFFDDLMVVEGDVMPSYYPSTAEIGMNPDGTLTGGSGGKVTLPGMGQNTFRIFAKGNTASAAPAVTPGLYKNGTLLYGVARSYTLVAIRRTDLVVAHYGQYDVYGVGAAGGSTAATLAGDLNYYADRPGQYVMVLYSHDEPLTHRGDSGLPDAIYRNGGSRTVFGSPRFKGWSAYALVGISGCGENNGAEAYQGVINQDPNAWIDVTFTMMNGDIISINANYTPTSLQDYGYVGALDATNGAPKGSLVGSNLAENVESWALSGLGAAQALPGIQTSINDKLSASGSNILRAPITITTGGGVVVGTLLYNATNGLYGSGKGVAITPYGIIGHNGTKYTFAISTNGDAEFGGNLNAAYGTFGALSIAPGGFIAQGFNGTWNWSNKAPGPGFLLHPNGMLFGDANDGNYGYVQINANGELHMPGFDYAGRQLTIDSPIIVRPRVQTGLSVSIPTTAIRNVSGNSYTFNVGCTISGGSGSGYRYAWTFSPRDGSAPMTLVSDPGASMATIKATGAGWKYGYLTVTVYDGGVAAVASSDVSLQFGNAVEP